MSTCFSLSIINISAHLYHIVSILIILVTRFSIILDHHIMLALKLYG